MNFHEIFVFNDFFTISWNIMKPTWYIFIHWKLSNDTKSMTRHHGLGDFNVTNKSNKVPFFIHKYWRFSNTISEENT